MGLRKRRQVAKQPSSPASPLLTCHVSLQGCGGDGEGAGDGSRLPDTTIRLLGGCAGDEPGKAGES
jgi:hypothetical protein